ncbi:MAG: META domain-containing protein [Planctomycetota bacterium]
MPSPLPLALCLVLTPFAAASAGDPLPSWNEGAAKQSLLRFVERVTEPSGKDFVPAAERIAVFDNDGTLWTENPVPNQVAFAIDEIKRMLPSDPEWKGDPAVQALLNEDTASLMADGHKGLMRLLAITHSGLTNLEFERRVSDWLASTRHPRFQMAYDRTIYQPMLEVLAYLRGNGFQTWIVSGGGQDFMRVFAEDAYGIPPEQIIGSHGALKYTRDNGIPTLTKTLDSVFVDDKEGKPVAIAKFIGRRPIAAFGNSNGDQAMLEYTTMNNPHPSYGLIVHHTDAGREYAYDANPSSSGKLTTALQDAPERGWTVVDMQRDWKTVFPVDKIGMPTNQAGTASAAQLSGEWLAEDIDGGGVIENAQSTIRFAEDGRVTGSTSVNRFSGQIEMDGQSVSIGPLATTRMAGPPEWMDQEKRFTEALQQTKAFRFDDQGRLHFLDDSGKAVARFSRMQ